MNKSVPSLRKQRGKFKNWLLFSIFILIFPLYSRGQNSVFTVSEDSVYNNQQFTVSVNNPNLNYNYYWNLEDGSTYQGNSFSHQFSINNCLSNYYTINLIIDSSGIIQNISDSIYLKTTPPLPLLADIDIITPFSNCDNSPSNSNPDFSITLNNITNNSTYIDFYTVKWGDSSQTDTFFNSSFPITYTYTQLGLFNLEIKSHSGNCTNVNYYDIANQSNPAVGLSSPGNTQGCTPQTFQFDLSQYQYNSPGTYYVWDFGDGSNDTTWDYNHPFVNNSISHTFTNTSCSPNSNSFTVKVTAYNSCDHTTATVGNIRIYSPPQADISSSTDTSCAGNQVDFINNTIAGFGYNCSSIASYSWDFGDTNSANNSSSSQNASHNYNFAGNYTITLTADNGICGATSDSINLYVEQPVNVAAQTSINEACVPFNSILQSNSSGSNIENQWHISPSQGWTIISGNLNSASPEIQFDSAGIYTVKLISSNYCGSDDTTFEIIAKSSPVIQLSSIADFCNNASINPSFNLDSNYAQINSYNWNFNSGSPAISNTKNPGQINFSNGNYKIKLEVSNICGSNIDSTEFKVFAQPQISLSSTKNEICFGDTTLINASGNGNIQFLSTNSILNNYGNTIKVKPLYDEFYYATITDSNNCSLTDSIEIKVNALPNINISTNNSVICNGDTADLSASGANNYIWKTNNNQISSSNSISISPSTTTNYITIGTDNNSCTNSDTITINVENPPVVNFSTYNPSICEGDSIQINLSGAYSYQWQNTNGLNTNNSASPVFYPQNSDTFFLSAFSNLNCKTDTSIFVNVYQKPNVIATTNKNAICFGDTINLSASGANNYEWINNQTIYNSANISLNPVSSTTYILKGTDNNLCSNYDTLNINVKPLPNIQINTNKTAICEGDSVILSAQGGQIYNWKINNQSISNSISLSQKPNSTTTYTLYGIDSNSCSNIDSVSINVNSNPVISSNYINPEICKNDSIQIQLSGANNFNWYSSGSLQFSASSLNLSPANSVNYQIIGIDNNNCSDSINLKVKVNPLPVINAKASSNSLCLGQSTELIASGANTYYWSPASNLNSNNSDTVIATPNQTTKYYLSGIDSNQCRNTDSILINVSAQLNINLSASDTNICNGDTVSLIATGADTYQWINPQNLITNNGSSISVKPDNSVQYVVTGTDTNSCISTKSIQINVNPLPNVMASTNNSNICPGDSVHLSAMGALNYQWNINNNPFSQQQSLYVYPSSTTTYQLSGTDANGCVNTNQITINISPVPNLSINSQNDSICIGSSVAINASGASNYFWTTNNSSFNSNNSTIVVNPQTSTKYYLSGINNYGCISYDSISITTLDNPIINLNNVYNLCKLDSLQLNLDTNLQYSFSPQVNYLAAQNKAYLSPTNSTAYNVSATNNNNCSSTKNIQINVKPLPNVDFNSDSVLCVNSNNNFTNQSSGANSFTWKIHNYTTNSQNTSYTFNNTGIEEVKLIAYSPYNCVDSISKFVNIVDAPQISYTSYPSSGCGPLNVQFINNTSAYNTSYNWNFGNGQSSNASGNINITFNDAYSKDTNYQVLLTASNICGVDSLYDSIFVKSNPHSNFGYSLQNQCSPASVSFANGSQGNISSYSWDFGNNNTSNAQNPSSQTYVANNSDSTYSITLITSNSCGSDTATQDITILPNTVNAFFTPSSYEACAPATIQFTNNSNVINNANWDFDNGTTSSLINPNVSFSAGTYNVSLIVSDFCGIDTATKTITVYNPPQLSISTSKDTACQGEDIMFTNTSQSSLSSIEWIFGDGISDNTNQSINHTYITDSTYTIKFIGSGQQSGCVDTIQKNILIKKSAIANFTTSSIDGCTPLNISFSNQSSAASYYNWDFGNGNTSTAQIPSNTYYNSGNHQIQLIANNANNCPDTVVKQITSYPKPQSDFSLPSSPICNFPANVQLTNNSTGASGFQWDFDNGNNSTQNNPIAVYNQADTFNIKLIATNMYNCADTTTKNLIIENIPQASFSTDKIEECEYTAVSFIDESINAVQYYWDFGDGSSSNQSNPLHSYKNQGSYIARLIVSNNAGCTDTFELQNQINIHPLPKVDFDWQAIHQNNKTRGLIQFNNLSQNADKYFWDFDDGEYSDKLHPTKQYHNFGYYRVNLQAENKFGCYNDTTKEIMIQLIKTLYIPNAIAPTHANEDLRYFTPKGKGLEKFEIYIYDKWGTQVYYSDKLENGSPAESWDGTYMGKALPTGAYIWKVRAEFKDGSLWQSENNNYKQGIIQLIR